MDDWLTNAISALGRDPARGGGTGYEAYLVSKQHEPLASRDSSLSAANSVERGERTN